MKKLKVSREWLREEYVVNKRTRTDLAKEIGCHPVTVAKLLRRHGIKCRGQRKTATDLMTRKFGKLYVERRHGSNTNGNAVWLCICECGKRKSVVAKSLLTGATTSCGCYRQGLKFEGCGNLGKGYWSRVLRAAKKRGLSVDITIDDAWRQFIKQGGKCAITGIQIALIKNYCNANGQHTASLDRTNSSLGYTVENIQWVHRDVNIMKNKFLMDYFLDLCRKALEHNGYIIAFEGQGTAGISPPLPADACQVETDGKHKADLV